MSPRQEFVATVHTNEGVVVNDEVYRGPDKRTAIREIRGNVKAAGPPAQGEVRIVGGRLVYQVHHKTLGHLVVEEL